MAKEIEEVGKDAPELIQTLDMLFWITLTASRWTVVSNGNSAGGEPAMTNLKRCKAAALTWERVSSRLVLARVEGGDCGIVQAYRDYRPGRGG